MFELSLNRYGKVPRPRALQPVQYIQASCLQNECESFFCPKCNSLCFPSFSRPHLGFQILASRSWLPDPGCHILATRSLLPDQILAIWSYLERSYLELSEAILSYLKLSGAIWSYLELSGAIWSHLCRQ